jgi:hypothetical protein
MLVETDILFYARQPYDGASPGFLLFLVNRPPVNLAVEWLAS